MMFQFLLKFSFARTDRQRVTRNLTRFVTVRANDYLGKKVILMKLAIHTHLTVMLKLNTTAKMVQEGFIEVGQWTWHRQSLAKIRYLSVFFLLIRRITLIRLPYITL